MPKKIYCVKVGRITGKFYDWDTCKAHIQGYKGAIYKSFTSEIDADNYLNGNNKPFESDLNSEKAIAYVDGSYNKATNEFSCGAIIMYQGKEEYISKKYNDEKYAQMNNVAGEIMGAAEVMRYCIENNIKNVSIYHDYEGVARWAMGDWKTNKKETLAYKNFCDSIRNKLNFDFVKVKGHSNDKYNDLADKLAKQALGIV